MDIVKGFSVKPHAEDAVKDIKDQFGAFKGRVIVYFASSAFDQETLSRSMRAAFPGAELMGCSTSGEIVSGRMLKNSVVAMGLNGAIVEDVKLAVMEGIDQKTDVEKAFAGFESHTGRKMQDLDFEKYVGIILVDGLRGAEERIMERIGDLTNVTFIGGSAGDDLKFKETQVHANGRSYTNAAVLGLIKVKKGFDIIKTQSFKTLGKQLTVTKACAAKRQVLEFNGKPAVKAYAEAVGIPVDQSDSCFMKHPVGLMVDGEPYVRSPQQVQGESMVFYCNVLEGMDLSLLESTDIVKDTAEALKAKQKEAGQIAGLINFHCILRTLELEQKGQGDAYGKLFADLPAIGFSTYGEEYCGHINQTSTMLVFKQ
jgi:hypothetical protein